MAEASSGSCGRGGWCRRCDAPQGPRRARLSAVVARPAAAARGGARRAPPEAHPRARRPPRRAAAAGAARRAAPPPPPSPRCAGPARSADTAAATHSAPRPLADAPLPLRCAPLPPPSPPRASPPSSRSAGRRCASCSASPCPSSSGAAPACKLCAVALRLAAGRGGRGWPRRRARAARQAVWCSPAPPAGLAPGDPCRHTALVAIYTRQLRVGGSQAGAPWGVLHCAARGSLRAGASGERRGWVKGKRARAVGGAATRRARRPQAGPQNRFSRDHGAGPRRGRTQSPIDVVVSSAGAGAARTRARGAGVRGGTGALRPARTLQWRYASRGAWQASTPGVDERSCGFQGVGRERSAACGHSRAAAARWRGGGGSGGASPPDGLSMSRR
jgi:hypothetical protein